MPVSSSTVTVQIVLEPDIGPRVAGRQHQVHRHRDAAARVEQQHLAEVVGLRLEILHPLEHRLARRRQHAADDDTADLAFRMRAYYRDRLRPTHGRTLPMSL